MDRVDEGLDLHSAQPGERDAEIAALDRPWIADEGPCDVGFRRGLAGPALRMRGIAFDRATTVVWDEDGVQVLRAGPASPDLVAFRSRVICREGFPAPDPLYRIDYLASGSLLGSRYTFEGDSDA